MSDLPSVKSLSEVPLSSKAARAYVWADYIELLCLTNVDRRVSKSDVLDRVWESQDLGEVEEFRFEDMQPEVGLLPDELEEGLDELDFYHGESEQQASAGEHTLAERSDRNHRQAEQWFEHLASREAIFGEFYPFELDGDVLCCKESIDADEKCRLYIFLLLASCLKYFDNFQYLTDRFEILSLVALKNYLPKRAKVSFVGKNALNRGRYNGTAWHRITTLKNEIGEELAPRCTKDSLSPNDTGDKGLDVLGRIPIGSDTEPGLLLLLGQCACGKEWTEKKYESHEMTWRTYIDFTVAPISVMFIPYCFRTADGSWFKYADVRNNILVDRLRLIYLLRGKLELVKRCHPFDGAVDLILEYEEPVV